MSAKITNYDAINNLLEALFTETTVINPTGLQDSVYQALFEKARTSWNDAAIAKDEKQ